MRKVFTPQDREGQRKEEGERDKKRRKFEVNEEVGDFLGSYLGRERWENILEALCLPPLCSTLRCDLSKRTREETITLLQEKLTDIPPSHISPSLHFDDVIQVRAVGPREVTPAHKAYLIDARCGEALLRGANLFAVGVIAKKNCGGFSNGGGLEEKKGEEGEGGEEVVRKEGWRGDKVAVYVDQYKVYLKGATDFDVGLKGIVFIGNGEQVNKDGVALKMTDTHYKHPSLSSIVPSLVFAQNLPSMVVGWLVYDFVQEREREREKEREGEGEKGKEKEGEEVVRVLDMCAAPGGKTTHVANLLGEKANIVAMDRSKTRVVELQKLIETLGLSHRVQVLHNDSAKAAQENKEKEKEQTPQPQQQQPQQQQQVPRGQGKKFQKKNRKKKTAKHTFPPESFDIILLDAPCSGLGLRPRFANDLSLPLLKEYADYSRHLLKTASKLVKKGGTIVYSTCTLNPLENEMNVGYGVSELGLKVVSQGKRHLGGVGLVVEGLGEEERGMVQRFDPSSELDTNGFFVAKFVKM